MAALKEKTDQTLPAKEAALFRTVVKSYESKQYKKGIKAADQVLKKFPDHGETLSMKGLTLNCMSKKDEAYDLVRKGLKCDLKSHVCWHVYGLLYRSDRVYNEAAKCYLNALRIDKDNSQILQDLALLQVQLRDTAGFVGTRNRLLNIKPGARNNWIGLAIAHHLNGNLDVAVAVLDAYQGTITEVPAGDEYEHSEMLLYKATILEEDGKLAEAAAFLEASKASVVDKISLFEAQAALHLKLGQKPAAEAIYRRLLAINPDCHEYHVGLRAALGLSPPGGLGDLTDAQVQQLADEYKALRLKHKYSSACKRLPLDFLRGAPFEAALAEYIQPFLRKGVPSLFADLKPLYATPAKVASLNGVIVAAEKDLRSRSAFPGAADKSEAPGVLPWALMLLSQHHAQCGRVDDAIKVIDEAISHTPTVIDLYLIKADLHESKGEHGQAADVADEARQMDLADRYLNCVAVQKMLAAGRTQEAEDTVVLFARSQDGGGSNLVDMQCMWYELASGDCNTRAGSWGPALKRYHQIRKHFEDFQEDQFDFHTYCVRKMTLRAYVNMLRMANTLSGHEYYRRAAAGAVRVYLALDKERAAAAAAAGGLPSEAELAAMPPNERKKARAKMRKAEAAAVKQKEDAAPKDAKDAGKAGEKGGGGKGGDKGKEVDKDPHGAALAEAADPLGEATKFLAILLEYADGELATQLLAFEVYRRKGRMLLALRAVLRAQALAPTDPEVHVAAVQLATEVTAAAAVEGEGAMAAVVRGVVEEGLKQRVLGGKDLGAFHAAWKAAAKPVAGQEGRWAEATAAAAALVAGRAEQ